MIQAVNNVAISLRSSKDSMAASLGRNSGRLAASSTLGERPMHHLVDIGLALERHLHSDAST
jgi:hypothetical protein